jgi:hypothetical protein
MVPALCLLLIQSGCAIPITPTPEPTTITFLVSQEAEDYDQPLIEAFHQERSAPFLLPVS